MMTFRKSARIAAILSLALAVTTGAQAQTAEIRHNDLDLTTLAGRDKLDRRINAAAARICRAESVTGSRIVDTSARQECIANVRRQVADRLALRTGAVNYGR